MVENPPKESQTCHLRGDMAKKNWFCTINWGEDVYIARVVFEKNVKLESTQKIVLLTLSQCKCIAMNGVCYVHKHNRRTGHRNYQPKMGWHKTPLTKT